MKLKTEFAWCPEDGIATCTIYYKDKKFEGIAECAEDDMDMISSYTGNHIAEYRATIAYLKHIRDNELKPQIAVLKELYYNMKDSKKFNNTSYEYYTIKKKYFALEEDLNLIKDMIKTERHCLNKYLDEKEKLFQKLRNNREKDKAE